MAGFASLPGRVLRYGLSCLALATTTVPAVSAAPGVASAVPSGDTGSAAESYDVFSVAQTRFAAVPAPVRPILILSPAAPVATPVRIVAVAPVLPPVAALVVLPGPVDDPLRVGMDGDPVLALGRVTGSADLFRRTIAQAVTAAPSALEARAEGDAAVAARGQARAGLFPTVDITATGYRTLARDFTGDVNTIVERSRGQGRTDALIDVRQTVIDFGATSIRIAAAGARLRAAAAGIDATADQVALRSIAIWYDVFVARAMVGLSTSFTESQRGLRAAIVLRIRQGVAAEGDLARVDSAIAAAEVRVAGHRRAQADAEARFAQLLRAEPPVPLMRPPLLDARVMSRDFAAHAALSTPAALSAGAQADAARDDARAARRDTLPTLTAGVQAGRYGFLENLPAYDVRGVLTVRQRLFGGTESRVQQIRAQAGVADARAMRAREEAARDGVIAWSDVTALEDQLSALERSYIAARRSRDVLVERFRFTRGTLFDVLAAQDAFLFAATAYVQGLGDRDAARYVLLSRTGRLLPALSIPTAQGTLR